MTCALCKREVRSLYALPGEREARLCATCFFQPPPVKVASDGGAVIVARTRSPRLETRPALSSGAEATMTASGTAGSQTGRPIHTTAASSNRARTRSPVIQQIADRSGHEH